MSQWCPTLYLMAPKNTRDSATAQHTLNPRMLTCLEAADKMGVSERFIRRLVHERRLTFVKVGAHVRIRSDDIEAFLEAGRVEAIGA